MLDRRELLALPFAALADRSKKPASPFLQGNYAPVRDEVNLGDLKVVGKLPEALDGMFLRNGPNPQFDPIGPYHWFDGDGMIHGLRLQGGKASYRNRFVRTQGYEEEKKEGKALYQGLTGLPDFRKIAMGKEGYKNAANTALVWHAGKLLALWEGGKPHVVTLPDLATVGVHDFGGKLKHACTAHPKIDPVTGEMFVYGYQPTKPYVRYAVADKAGVIRHTAGIDLPRAVMMHDFAITARHAVFMDLPMTFDFRRLFKRQAPFAFEPKHGARIGIMPRHGKTVKWFNVEPCYVFHTFNAWDEGDEVVLLGCRMKSFPVVLTPPDQMTEKQLKEEGARPWRWRLNLKTGKTTEGPLDDMAADFPRVNDLRMGRKTRYGYGMKLSMDALAKYDFDKGTILKHDVGKGRRVGEGIFVARPGGKGEDEGWVLALAHDVGSGKGELLVLDAQDFAGKPVARVALPRRVPFGFHAAWVPSKAWARP